MNDIQQQLDAKNAAFWDELCGSSLARSLGVTDSGKESLRKFDDWYMDYYPYLHRHIPFAELKGRKVLEVGLGYGTISQMIAKVGADYRGLDIAANPVGMVNHRLRQNDLSGEATQGNMLFCPFGDGQFDWVIAIGCFHHTGNLQRCLDESRRVLRPGGQAMIMVYNAYSYRRWMTSRSETFRYFLWDKLRFGTGRSNVSAEERARYDDAKDGSAAPETVFTSAAHMKRMAREWSAVEPHRENIAVGEWIFKGQSREAACRWFGPICGLDLYCHFQK